jgi:hypothetical protein
MTNLSLAKDGGKRIRDVTLGTPWSNKHQSTDGIKRGRLSEHGGDGFIQSARSDLGSHRVSNVPLVEDEPWDDHEGEKDVHREGNRKLWIIEAEGEFAPVASGGLGSLVVDEHDTHLWIIDVSGKCRFQITEDSNT